MQNANSFPYKTHCFQTVTILCYRFRREVIFYLLFLYLCFDHFKLCRWRFLIIHKFLCVGQPAEKRLQRILKPATVQQCFMKLSRSVCNLKTSHTYSTSYGTLTTAIMKTVALYLQILAFLREKCSICLAKNTINRCSILFNKEKHETSSTKVYKEYLVMKNTI